MRITALAAKAANEIAQTLEKVSEDKVQQLIEASFAAGKVFFAGGGRSLLALRAIAMRFMHVGLKVHVVGDVTTPALLPEDLLIIGSGSGETSSLVSFAKKAKGIGGKVALISTREQSTLAELSDILIRIPAFTDKVNEKDQTPPTLPGGTLFEEAMLVLGDTMILQMAEKQGVATDEAFALHANLE